MNRTLNIQPKKKIKYYTYKRSEHSRNVQRNDNKMNTTTRWMFVKNKTVHIIIYFFYFYRSAHSLAHSLTHTHIHAHNFNCFQVTNIVITTWLLLLRVQLLLFAAFCMSFSSFLYVCMNVSMFECIVRCPIWIGISNYWTESLAYILLMYPNHAPQARIRLHLKYFCIAIVNNNNKNASEYEQ